MTSLTLHPEGMSCGHCVEAVRRTLSALPGVEVDSVDIGRAKLRYDESVIQEGRIEVALAEAGYPPAAE
ncbi:MAG TPA: cation transporter [Gemmatimonadales bacterium]|nr:cation transporter [Gemmatimonadales bacterium]